MEEERDWLQMPDEIMGGMILQRLGAIDILMNAQKVCRNWRRICKDPAMWRVIDFDIYTYISYQTNDFYYYSYISYSYVSNTMNYLEKLTKHAVDCSCGELIDIRLKGFATNDLIDHISRCSSKLNRLCLIGCYGITGCRLSNAVKMLPHLETLTLYDFDGCAEDIEAIGRNCPLLKSFTIKRENGGEIHAHAIANSMPALRHLTLAGTMDNDKIRAILNGCPHLESLDLSGCIYLDLDENLEKMCRERIKDFYYVRYNNRNAAPYLQWTIMIATSHIHRSSVLNMTGLLVAGIGYRMGAFESTQIAKKKLKSRFNEGKEIMAAKKRVYRERSSRRGKTPNWLQLPDEIMGGMILQRLGAVQILISAQKNEFENLAKQAVHRSRGQLIDISLKDFGTDELLHHISRCSSKLNCLCLSSCYDITPCGLSNALKSLPHLETLELYDIDIRKDEDIEWAGGDVYARAIAKSMPALRHLKLFGLMKDDNGVQAILNGCPHLESLDLRGCPYHDLDLDENLEKLCTERIKDFKYNISESEEDSDTDW
ncbi:hypothetical protein OSB04_001912 [Centaurea solstitialis]|uniref:F-box domain-containing protein n=1 Tax=Centaurea solstitialis TaxID=347529 RepID=A0AA38U2G3_9ASTR|nr:hypothetical protein OSB04_001912 [Centaurea solstitialis]